MRLYMRAFESEIRAPIFASLHTTKGTLKVRPDCFFAKRRKWRFILQECMFVFSSIPPLTAADWKLILKRNLPVESDLFRDLFNSVLVCGIEIRTKSEPDTSTRTHLRRRRTPRGGFYRQSRTWTPQCRKVSHFSAKLPLRSILVPPCQLCFLPACLSLRVPVSWFHQPSQTFR